MKNKVKSMKEDYYKSLVVIVKSKVDEFKDVEYLEDYWVFVDE